MSGTLHGSPTNNKERHPRLTSNIKAIRVSTRSRMKIGKKGKKMKKKRCFM